MLEKVVLGKIMQVVQLGTDVVTLYIAAGAYNCVHRYSCAGPADTLNRQVKTKKRLRFAPRHREARRWLRVLIETVLLQLDDEYTKSFEFSSRRVISDLPTQAVTPGGVVMHEDAKSNKSGNFDSSTERG
jgi:hypothetical protein